MSTRRNPRPPGISGIISELRNYYGPLSPEIRAKLLAFVEDPSPQTWAEVYSKIIREGIGRRRTVWQYVTAVDPTFPKVGPRSGQAWTVYPDSFTFLRALKLAAQERGDVPPDPPPDDDGEPIPLPGKTGTSGNPRGRRSAARVSPEGRARDHAEHARRFELGALGAQEHDIDVAIELWRRAAQSYRRAGDEARAAQATARLDALQARVREHEGREEMLAW